mgnify:CR=1 FL=1
MEGERWRVWRESVGRICDSTVLLSLVNILFNSFYRTIKKTSDWSRLF